MAKLLEGLIAAASLIKESFMYGRENFGENILEDKHTKRATLCLLGIDLKITSENEVKIIEINGANSGMKGFAYAYSLYDKECLEKDSPNSRRADLLVPAYLSALSKSKIIGNKPIFIFPWEHSDWEATLFSALNIMHFGLNSVNDGNGSKFFKPIYYSNIIIPNERTTKGTYKDNYIESFLDFYDMDFGLEFCDHRPLGKEKNKFLMKLEDTKAIVWNRSMLYRFDENKHLVMNPYPIELLLNDKLKFAKITSNIEPELFPRSAEIPLFRIESKQSHYLSRVKLMLEEIVNWGCSNYVLKPVNSSQGNMVYVFPRDMLVKKGNFHLKLFKNLYDRGLYREYVEDKNCYGFFIQEFIQSKPIQSCKTGRYHDGCMRFIVLMLSEGGEIRPLPFGGYWRLSPAPLGSNDSQRSRIANLKNNAIAEPALDSEIDFVWKTIEPKLKKIYKEMLWERDYEQSSSYKNILLER